MKKSFSILALALSLLSFAIYTQNSFSEQIIQKLNNYTKNNYPEKIYIQTDKPIYDVDENIWFTSYLVNGITHQKTEKSRVIHVDLINPKDSIVATRNLYVDDISVAGDFKINKNWEAGNYKLRGYTNYMRNGNSEDFFYKNISIYNLDKDSITNTTEVLNTTDIISKNTKKKTKPEIYFYPEGGYLVNGIHNKVAFQVKVNGDHNIDFTGSLKNQNDKEIAEIKTIEFGVGTFVFTPQPNENYYVSVNVNGTEEKYPLPKTIKKGYGLNVINNNSIIGIDIRTNIENGLQGTFLVAHQRGKLLYSKYEETNKSNYTLKIPTKKLRNGIVNITLFNPDGHPVAERSVFVNSKENNLKLSLKTEKETFKSRQKVTLKLDLTNTNGQKEESTLSMAVRDLKAFPYNTRSSNIKTYLLLNSDLRGQVKNPGYYFEKDNDVKRNYLLDLVMMINGWKRFTWQEILDHKEENNQFLPEQGLFISGTTKQLKKPYQTFSSPTRLTFLGKVVAQEPIKESDSLGKFTFGPYVFFDSIPVIIEARTDHFNSKSRKSRDVIILVDNKKTSPVVDKNTKLEISKNKENQNFTKVTKYIKQVKFEYDQEVQKLQTVELIAKKQSEEEQRQEEMSSLTDYGEPLNGQRLDVLNDKHSVSSFTAFEIVSRMNSVSTFGDSIFIRRDKNTARILLDGLEIDGNFLRSIQGSEISFIDVLIGSDAATFSNASGGVIALYSNTGNIGSRNIKRKPGIIDFNAEGFYTARKFYSPDHINDFELLNRSDLRTTLYWEPMIKTSRKTNTEISFFTSDLKSDYIIEVEGISANGQPIHAIKTFNVE